MTAAVAAGARMINDVCALQEPGALETAARLGVPVCLMHMQGRPRDMQADPFYADVVAEVEGFLLRRAREAAAAGVAERNIILDPGFGFGKKLEHNIVLFRAGLEARFLPTRVRAGDPQTLRRSAAICLQ